MKERLEPIHILIEDCCPSFFTVPVFRSKIRPDETQTHKTQCHRYLHLITATNTHRCAVNITTIPIHHYCICFIKKLKTGWIWKRWNRASFKRASSAAKLRTGQECFRHNTTTKTTASASYSRNADTYRTSRLSKPEVISINKLADVPFRGKCEETVWWQLLQPSGADVIVEKSFSALKDRRQDLCERLKPINTSHEDRIRHDH